MQPQRPLEVFTFMAVLASLPLGLAAQSPVSVSAQLDFKTKYLFAGLPFAAGEVTQATITVGTGAFTFNAFAVTTSMRAMSPRVTSGAIITPN